MRSRCRDLRLASAALAAAMVASCLLPGPEDIRAEATARLLVTGAEPGERLAVDVGALSLRAVARDEAVLEFLLRLPAGRHDGRVRGERGLRARCQPFAVEVDAVATPEAVAVDLRQAGPCTAVDAAAVDGGVDASADATVPDAPRPDSAQPDGGDLDASASEQQVRDLGGADLAPHDGTAGDAQADDAGEPVDASGDDAVPDDATGFDGGERRDVAQHDLRADEDAAGGLDDAGISPALDLLAETIQRTIACAPTCTQITTVTGDGRLRLEIPGSFDQTASIPAMDLEALRSVVLSGEADLLFAGLDTMCAQPRPPQADERVDLERRIRLAADGGLGTEQVNVTGCAGVATSIRTRLRFLRELLFPGQGI